MISWTSGIGICLLTFIGMEGLSWSIHKFLFHGPLWFIHKTHHNHKAHTNGFWEANDVFSLGFALTSMILIIIGVADLTWHFWTGLGITLYGLVYFLVHDVLAHRRLKWWRSSKNSYLNAVVRAHKMHHKHLQKEDGEAFGLLWVRKQYFTNRKK
ncbi:MAG: sterol desaturase family protein [Bacteroidia bacterium]